MRKTTYKIIFASFILSVLISISSFTVIAAGLDYVPLEPGAFKGIAPGYGGTTGEKLNLNDLGGILNGVFNWGIAIAAVLALVMIVIGGIEYMTTDAWGEKSEGKKKIQDALMGLGLALVSWLILYTINPNLVDFSNNMLFK